MAEQGFKSDRKHSGSKARSHKLPDNSEQQPNPKFNKNRTKGAHIQAAPLLAVVSVVAAVADATPPNEDETKDIPIKNETPEE